MAILAVPASWAVDVAEENNLGVARLEEGEPEAALEHFQAAEVEAPGTTEVQLNIGNLEYQQDNWEEALRRYQSATLAPDDALRADAHYNSGTARMRIAQTQAEEGDLQTALRTIDQSIDDLRESLVLRPENWESKFNHEVAMRLRQQWEEQQQEQQGSQSDEQDQEEQQDQQSQSQQGQGQQSQDQQDQSQEEQQSQSQSGDSQENQEEQQQSNQRQSESENSQNQQDQQQGDSSDQQDQQQSDSQNQQGQQDQTQQQPNPNAVDPLSGEGGGEEQQPLSPEEMEQLAEQAMAESYLDLLPIEEYSEGMRNLMGMGAPPPQRGPDW